MPRLFALFLAVIILLLGAMTYIPLLREKAAQKRVHLQLQEELQQELARTRAIESRIASVKTDRPTLEKLGREKFGLSRTGEVVFKFRGDLPASTGQAQGRPTASRTAP